nr:hypothetical protein [Tanacetum cinerariifolium]
MSTPRPTPFPATTPRARVLIRFVIISDFDDEITTLPIRYASSSSDRIPTLSCYQLDFSDDSSDEDLSKTVESLPGQTASTSVVHPPPTRSLPTSHAFSQLPSSSPPISLLPSPSPSLLPSLSRKRLRSPSLSPPPLPSPPLTVLPPSPEVVIHVTSAMAAPVILRKMVEAHRWTFARDDIDTFRHQNGDPEYEMGEISQLGYTRLPREISVTRVEAQRETVEQRAEDLQETLERTRDEVHEHQ